jgi:signal transduction histidine kinase
VVRDKVHLSLFLVIPLILVLFALGPLWIAITILAKTIGPYLDSGLPVPAAATDKAFRWIGLSLGIGGATALAAGVLITYAITRPIRRFMHAFEDITLGRSPGWLRSEVSGEFAQLSDNFNRMLSSLKGQQAIRQAERLAALGALAAGVAHEIRNPLGSIRGLAQLLSEDETDSRRKKYADAIVAQTERLNGALDTLLHLARPTHSEMKRENLHDILRRASEMLDFELVHKGIELRRQFQNDLPGVVVDGEAMLQAFFNILLNAVQAAPKGAVILIQTESRSDRIRILIRNTGSVIPVVDRDRIFDPFFTTKEGGTGLGLAITHQVVTAHEGTIEVTSGEDGTTFAIEVPVERETEAAKRET